MMTLKTLAVQARRSSEVGQAMVDCLNRNRHVYFILVDSGGHIIECNDSMARLLGRSSETPQDESIWDSLTASDGARLKERLKQTPFATDPLLLNFVSRNHVPTTLDCSLASMPGGGVVLIGVSAGSSAEDSDAAWLQMNNSFANLSRENARKKKQLELKNSDLLRATEELKLANEALAESRTAALQAAQAKADFLHHMSHELRTPMNGVMGMVQLLLATELSAEQRRYATISQNSGRSLLALIDDILDLSKMEAQKITLENLRFSIQHTIEDVVQLLSVLANAKGLHIQAHVSEDVPPFVRGDERRLQQVLTNLAGNAIKFTARGEVTLDAALECKGNDTATVRFAVRDTGIGIRSDQAQDLFSPFVQADQSTARKYGGTGLGLAISKQLVEMMGGTIGIESGEGEGSTFWFTAVFGTSPEVMAPAAEPVPSSERKPGNCRIEDGIIVARGVEGPDDEPRILVAEDDPTNQAVALAQLEKLGYRADVVANGNEVLEALRQRRYDLVLMDSQMPTMDGYEATRRIRESNNSQIPIIGVTANATSTDRDKCIRVGMNHVLSKPVDLQLLAEVVTKWLLTPDSRGEIASGEQPVPGEQSVAVFDSEAFLNRLMGDRELGGIVVKGFVGDVPSQLNNLRERFLQADATGARLLAHTLKGSAATVSAGSLRALAQEMERAAGAGELVHCGELFPRVIEEFERLKRTLESAGWL
jgi:signal transduction histidine kinase/DNA-binding response OmpR family regulator